MSVAIIHKGETEKNTGDISTCRASPSTITGIQFVQARPLMGLDDKGIFDDELFLLESRELYVTGRTGDA